MSTFTFPHSVNCYSTVDKNVESMLFQQIVPAGKGFQKIHIFWKLIILIPKCTHSICLYMKKPKTPKKGDFTPFNPLPHGHIYSSTIPLRLIPQVEGQNIRPVTSWRFFDRTSYKPSSSRQKFAHLALTIQTDIDTSVLHLPQSCREAPNQKRWQVFIKDLTCSNR